MYFNFIFIYFFQLGNYKKEKRLNLLSDRIQSVSFWIHRGKIRGVFHLSNNRLTICNNKFILVFLLKKSR